MTDDALERRIARFVAEKNAPYSLNGTSDVCLGTSLGPVREQNQDRALVTFTSYPAAPEKGFTLGVVCGDEAAVIAVGVFVSRVIRWPSQPARDRLRWAALVANDAVYKSLGGLGGTTLAAVMVDGQGAVVGVNAGDAGFTGSRALARRISCRGTIPLPDCSAVRRGPGADQLVQHVGMGAGIQPRITEIDQEEFECVLITSDGVHCAPQPRSRRLQGPVLAGADRPKLH